MNIRRLYNRNRKTIWTFIIIIATIIIVLQLLNYLTIQNNKKQDNNKQNINTSIKVSSGNTSVGSTTSSISGSSISVEKLTTVANKINQFIEYCNNGKVEEAYNVLTEECKEKLYPTLNDFKNNYYNNIFSEKMVCEITNWVGDIYKIKLKQNPITTGVATEKYIEDYFTLKKVDGEYKLNISNYVGRKDVNKTTENKNISITIVSKDIFIDYEEYNIVVKNNSDKTIQLDNLDSTKTIYLQDSSNIKYYSYSHELLEENMIIKSKYTKKLSIKFSNTYSSSRTIQRVVFSGLILNYGEEESNNYIFQVNT